jgi:hypothetical protein
MSHKIRIILTRANWCPHCHHFEPIFNAAKNIYKEFGELNNYEIKFEDYDLADDDIKNTFMINHYNIKDKIKGYPTVFINFKNKNQNTNDYITIDHTVIDENIKKANQHEEAAKRFIKNVQNVLSSLNSDNKVLYVQEGGNINNFEKEEIYKKKYIKYKSKYIELKKKI